MSGQLSAHTASENLEATELDKLYIFAKNKRYLINGQVRGEQLLINRN